MRRFELQRRVALVLSLVLFAGWGGVQAQSLNDGIAAMERGEFQRAFSILRRLEQGGDPRASALMEQMFGSAASTPPFMPPRTIERIDPETAASTAVVPPEDAAPAPPARPAATAAALRPAGPPRRSLRPMARPRPALPDFALPAPLGPQDFREVDEGLARLGHLLFFDPVLSGNRDMSCASCHLPGMADVDMGHTARPLWNLGAHELRVLTRDGRYAVGADDDVVFRTPHDVPPDSAPVSLLAAKAMSAPRKMAGPAGSNTPADARADAAGIAELWSRISARIDAIPAYALGFETQRDAVGPVRIHEIGAALAAFIEAEFRAIDTPFDRYLREEAALSPAAGEGMRLFFGKAACATCHSGPLLSDQKFHAMGQPPRDPATAPTDGRAAVTGATADAHAVRTPMLRNVARAGAWGHDGAFSDLEAFLVHHLDPVAGLDGYLARARSDGHGRAVTEALESVRTAAGRVMLERPLVVLASDEIGFLRSFLDLLTDEAAMAGRMGTPAAVPSGLPATP